MSFNQTDAINTNPSLWTAPDFLKPKQTPQSSPLAHQILIQVNSTDSNIAQLSGRLAEPGITGTFQIVTKPDNWSVPLSVHLNDPLAGLKNAIDSMSPEQALKMYCIDNIGLSSDKTILQLFQYILPKGKWEDQQPLEDLLKASFCFNRLGLIVSFYKDIKEQKICFSQQFMASLLDTCFYERGLETNVFGEAWHDRPTRVKTIDTFAREVWNDFAMQGQLNLNKVYTIGSYLNYIVKTSPELEKLSKGIQKTKDMIRIILN
jgi:hypothetical protein